MYRIRLGSGEEAVYRSLVELTQAIQTGVVQPGAQVFHSAASRWLPIELHPDYRGAVTGPRPAVAKVPERAHSDLVIEPTAPPNADPEPLQAPEPIALPVQEFEPEPEPAPPPTPLFKTRSTARRRAIQMVTVVAAAVAVVVVAAFLVWRAVLPRLARPEAVVSEGMPEPPAPDYVPRTFVDTAYPAPSPPLPINLDQDSAAPVVATRTSRLQATLNRTPTYFEAYADARAEMDEAFEYITFRQVFEPSRFASPESLRATRRMVAAAGNILRVYRGREVMLEQNYRPDDPGGRGSLREPFETAEATRALISDVDSLFGILLAQQGRLTYNPQGVRFQDASAARTYVELRTGIAAAVKLWRDSSGARDLVTMPRLIRALGDYLPPPSR